MVYRNGRYYFCHLDRCLKTGTLVMGNTVQGVYPERGINLMTYFDIFSREAEGGFEWSADMRWLNRS